MGKVFLCRGLLSPWLYIWYPRKLPLLRISRSCVTQGFEIVDLILFCTTMPYEYFKVVNVLPCFPFLFQKYRKYTINRWRVVYAMCAAAVISPLSILVGFLRWLVWKCVTRWSVLFICNTFSCWLLLLSLLYIELALVCCTNPDNVYCFGTIIAAWPVLMQSDQYSCSTVKRRGVRHSVHPDGEQPKTALWL